MTKDPITIAAASVQDIPEIIQFIRALARYEKLEHEVSLTDSLLRQHLFGEKPMAEVLFLNAGAKKVAFALFFHNFSTFLGKPGIYLEDLFVLPEERGQGYGKTLLKHLAGLAVARGCGRLEWSVLDWNTPALEFYRSLGATPMSEWTAQRVSGDALVELAKGSAPAQRLAK